MKIIKIAAILLMLFSGTGCWSKRELDEWVFVYGLFIDAGKEAGTIKVTINSPLPNHIASDQPSGSSASSRNPYTLVSQTAGSIPDALDKIQEEMTRRLNLSEIKVVLVGRNYAQNGMGELLEWIKGESTVSMGAYLLVTDDVDQLARLSPVNELMPTQILMSLAAERHMVDTNAKDSLVANASGFGFPLTYLKAVHVASEETQSKKIVWTKNAGIALFDQDKMKGRLWQNEAKALAWAYGHLRNPVYAVSWDDGENQASAMFTRSTSKYRLDMSSGTPVFEVQLEGRASLSKIKYSQELDNKAFGEAVLKHLQTEIAADLEKAMKKTQKHAADVLKLGRLVEWRAPDWWEQHEQMWSSYYSSDVQIKVSTDFRINDFGKLTPD